MSTKVRLNMDGLIAIANQINADVCEPIAAEIAAEVGGRVETDPRTGIDDWAHAYVVIDDPWPEIKSGRLSRALGGAKVKGQ